MTLVQEWKKWWDATAEERPEYSGDRSGWRVASPWRNPEGEDWWFTNGFKMYERWVGWRSQNHHLVIPLLDDGTPAIELEASPVVNGVTVKMFIDRVFYNTETNEYVIIDLKTGKNAITSSLQLGFYAYGLRKVYGLEVTKGYYWMARKGELGIEFDLAEYTDDKIETIVDMFDKARKAGIFLPNFNHCKMCGMTDSCEWFIKPRGETSE